MLQYDDSAFQYFALSFITLYLLPSWYTIACKVYKVFIGLSDSDVGAVVRTSTEKKKASELKKTFKGINTLKTKGFLINLSITVVLSIVFIYLITCLQEHGEVNAFDPYVILELDSGSEMKAVKKAFRTMSLIWHPDKNKNNPAAEAKFMLINKAYEALTDPVAKENWEKYGNPDGKQSMAVSIGLPSWLLDTNNRNLVLMSYLLIMVVIIPWVVYNYYSSSSKFGEKDVMYDTYSWFHHTLNEHTILKSLPEILAGSAEFRQMNMPKTKQDKEDVGVVMNAVRTQMQKPKFNHPVCVKGNVMLHAYLLRKTDLLSDNLKPNLYEMLKKSNALIEAMLAVCQHEDWLQTALNCIQFGQHIAQACWLKDSSLLQLPHFTDKEVKHCATGKQSVQAKNITQYLKIPDENKKGLADFTDEQKNDVLKACGLLPDITVDTKMYVDDDEDGQIYEGDLCTIEVVITRNNLTDGDKATIAHAPRFPFPKLEAWWVLLGTREGKIISVDKITKPDKTFSHKIKFMAPRQGTYEFDLYVKSTAYVDLDYKGKVKLVTLDNSVLPEYVIHPDDANLEEEPTLFEDMMNTNVEEDSDDETDSDDDDDDDDKEETTTKPKPTETTKTKLADLKNARKKAAAAQDQDSDSDDDSDVEEVFTDK